MTRRTTLAVLVLALGLVMPGGSMAASGKDRGAQCWVSNPTARTVFSSASGSDALEAAIAAAPAGSTLEVVGTCIGTFTIGRDLQLTGRSTPRQPTPTIDAGACGTVLTVNAARVSVSGLRITNGADGTASGCGDTVGGGVINNGGTLRLSRVSIVGNRASGSGGGIVNADGDVTLTRTTVQGNGAFTAGGGILTSGGSLTLDRSTIADNSSQMGGGIWSNGSTVVLKDSRITGNVATTGGGVVASSTRLLLQGVTRIASNTAFGFGGGLIANDTTITTQGWRGAVTGNSPDNCSPSLRIGSSTCS